MLPLLLSIALAQETPKMPEGAALEAAIAAADTQFFHLFFDQCEPAAVEAMVAPDFEMYHDRGGVTGKGREDFVDRYAKDCATRAGPDAWRPRRALVRASLGVHPVPGFGAIEEGDHLFYERKGDGPEKLVGKAHFVQLWKWTATGWQLARVFSYAHSPAS